MRRFWAILLMLCCAAGCCAARGEALPASLSQRDPRFHTGSYRYDGHSFKENGCGPASLTNALLAALNIREEDQAAALLLDMLHLLCAPEDSARSKLQLVRLKYLTDLPGAPDRRRTGYPALTAALADWGGAVTWQQEPLSPEAVARAAQTAAGSPRLMLGGLGKEDRWLTLCRLAQALRDAGQEDTVIAVAHLGAGTQSTQGPFRSGTAGHYVTLRIHVRTFLDTGAFDVMDSLPRALTGEKHGLGQDFRYAYAFSGKPSPAHDLKDFRALYRVERLSPALVRVTPAADAWAPVAALASSPPEERLAAQAALLKPAAFYGSGILFISLKPAP